MSHLLIRIFLGLLAFAAVSKAWAISDAIVYLESTKEPLDYHSPWQRQSVRSEAHLGVHVGDGLILTTAYAIDHARMVELQFFGQSEKHPVIIDFVDPEVNLAVLRAETEPLAALLKARKAAPLGDELNVPSEVSLMFARGPDRIGEIRSKVVEVNQSAVYAGYAIPLYSLEVARGRNLGWSEPVVFNGALAGMTAGHAQESIQAIPVSIIARFLRMYRSGEYRGFGGLGIRGRALVDPFARQLYGVGEVEGGLEIFGVDEDSPLFGVMQIGDVLTKMAGHSVSATGFFKHPKWGNHPISYLSNTWPIEEPMPIEFYRLGKPMKASPVLKQFDSNRLPISSYRWEGDEPHLIVGGMIFQELSMGYLRSFGNEWQKRAPLTFLRMWQVQNQDNSSASRKVVFLNRVLADEVNRGYQSARNARLVAVNGVSIADLQELEEALNDPKLIGERPYAVFDFDFGEGQIILDLELARQANSRIKSTYGLPSRARLWEL